MIISKQQMGIIKLKKHEIHINQEVSAHGKRRRNTTFKSLTTKLDDHDWEVNAIHQSI